MESKGRASEPVEGAREEPTWWRLAVPVVGVVLGLGFLRLGVGASWWLEDAVRALEPHGAGLKVEALSAHAWQAMAQGILGFVAMVVWSALVWRALDARQASPPPIEAHDECDDEDMSEQRVLAALGKMSALMAHELRNPLAAAMGQAELLEMLLPEGRTRDKAGEINRELERLEALSQNLLEFVNSHRVDVIEHSTTSLVDDVIRLARDPRLVVEMSDAPDRWSFDSVKLVRAVDNLVSNALSFSPELGEVTLTLREVDETFEISVRDRGEGFLDELEAFEPFVTTRVTGTGLGMAIASEIVTAHGGTISARNHPEGGAVVTMSLPRA